MVWKKWFYHSKIGSMFGLNCVFREIHTHRISLFKQQHLKLSSFPIAATWGFYFRQCVRIYTAHIHDVPYAWLLQAPQAQPHCPDVHCSVKPACLRMCFYFSFPFTSLLPQGAHKWMSSLNAAVHTVFGLGPSCFFYVCEAIFSLH